MTESKLTVVPGTYNSYVIMSLYGLQHSLKIEISKYPGLEPILSISNSKIRQVKQWYTTLLFQAS